MPPHGRSIVQEPSESFSDSPGERSQTVQMVRRFSRNVPGMMGLILVLIMALLSMGAPLLTNADPTSTDAMSILHAPEPEHPFGTDHLGRDVLSRFLYGSRVSILIGVSVAGVTAITGIVLGVLSGFYPRLDDPIMRAMDILMAFPVILLALGIVAILGPQLMNVFIALVVPYTPTAARVVRGMVLQVKEADFVEAARSIGASDWHIMRLHIVPNSLGPVWVQQSYILALAILGEATLSFLGVGVPPPAPTLGSIIGEGRSYLRTAPWLSVLPGLGISALVFGFNLLGDGVRDVMDPRLRTNRG